ncbi:PaaI family thioesterase [Haloferula sp. A504]|uniref:PaaI family thioesterase n=1 Tax=Haloferula sp. A504 TaxID=3373601 RepID=UPI0031C5071E|nr:PaaI family thioesterase [Verrucomicrobiaceae bacterium E54]
MHVRFRCHAPGEVWAEWQPDERWKSYDGTLHGGIAASLLDAAMVHALFSLGHRAVTASLDLRFRRGVRLGFPVEIEACRVGEGHGLHRMEATLSQGAEVCVRAEARFMETAIINSESS